MTQIRIEETVVEGRRLGRHINHDPRSRAFAFVAKSPTIVTTTHLRNVPIFDQGSLGSCTGNACVGAIGTSPDWDVLPKGHPTLNEALAIAVYSAATLIDSAPGSYPPDDTGSDGLSVGMIALKKGLISRVDHAFTLNDALAAVMVAPVITGINWYDSFDNPDSSGLVAIASGAQVRGGHEVCVVAVDAENKTITLANSWGASWGLNGYFSMSWATWGQLLAEQGDVTVLVPLAAVPTPAPTPVPPTPTPTPGPVPSSTDDVVLAAALHKWLKGCPFVYKTVQHAAKTWLAAKGL